MAEIKILESPSRQKQFEACELLGQLTYIDKWEPLEAHISLAPRLRGNGFSRACEVLHNAIKDGDVALLDQNNFVQLAVDEAVSRFDKQFRYCVDKGIRFRPGVDEISRTELRRIIPLYAKYTPFRANWKITHVEYPIKKFSSRPDLGGVDNQGFDFTGDMKYKSSLEVRWENDTIEEFHWDPQFQQYPHAHKDLLGYGNDRTVYSYLFLVVGQPFRIKSVGWVYTPEQNAMWYKGAEASSNEIREITSGTRLPRPSVVHRNKYGWCTMKKACFEYYLDPELMKRDYVQLDELPE